MLLKIALGLMTLLSTQTCEKRTKTTAENQKNLPEKQQIIDSAHFGNFEKNTETAADFSEVVKDSTFIYLKEGENKFFKAFEMNITFKKMLEDSRCPKDVKCIWAGNAKAEIEVTGTYTRPMTFELSTLHDEKKGFLNSKEFNGYLITVVDVSPETTSAKGFSALKGNYEIKLQIEKIRPQ